MIRGSSLSQKKKKKSEKVILVVSGITAMVDRWA
jgi:hypothetical protein